MRLGCGRVRRSGSEKRNPRPNSFGVTDLAVALNSSFTFQPAGPIVTWAVSGVAGMTEVLKTKARRLHEQFAAEATGRW